MGGCKYNPVWNREFPWAKPVEGHSSQYYCVLCLKASSCEKGRSELVRHDKGEKHKKRVQDNTSASSGSYLAPSTIVNALKKSEELASNQRKSKDDAHKAEVMLSNLIATHNLPLHFYDCFAELLPKIITDSNIVKNMQLHGTKARYTLVHGIAPFVKEKVIKQMVKWPFSLNFDESCKNKTSQLDIVVSFRNEQKRIQVSHFSTVDMKVGLTGENISDAVFEALEAEDIPFKKNLVR